MRLFFMETPKIRYVLARLALGSEAITDPRRFGKTRFWKKAKTFRTGFVSFCEDACNFMGILKVWFMNRVVPALIYDFKILDSIVGPIFNRIHRELYALMMNEFKPPKFSSKEFFHHMAVFKNRLLVYIDNSISSGNLSGTLWRYLKFFRMAVSSEALIMLSAPLTPLRKFFTIFYSTHFRHEDSMYHATTNVKKRHTKEVYLAF